MELILSLLGLAIIVGIPILVIWSTLTLLSIHETVTELKSELTKLKEINQVTLKHARSSQSPVADQLEPVHAADPVSVKVPFDQKKHSTDRTNESVATPIASDSEATPISPIAPTPQIPSQVAAIVPAAKTQPASSASPVSSESEATTPVPEWLGLAPAVNLFMNQLEKRQASPQKSLTPSTTKDSKPVEFKPPEWVQNADEAVKNFFKKVWNWIIVGEEKVPAGMSMEYAIASQWLMRFGVMIVLIGIGFFLKYSIENELISEVGRVALTVMAGLVTLTFGIRLLPGSYRILGHGLMGIGIVSLYFASYSAYHFHGLITTEQMFVSMAMITALSGGIAILFQVFFVGLIAVIGGYLTPLLFATEQPQYFQLYTYMTILALGVFRISRFRNWPSLSYLAMLLHYGLFSITVQDYASESLGSVLVFGGLFFVIFNTMITTYKLKHRLDATPIDLLAQSFNALVIFWAGFDVITSQHPKQYVAILTLTMATYFLIQVIVLQLRKTGSYRLMTAGFIGFSAFFLTITMPMLLSSHWLTVSWSIQGLIMLWISGQVRSQFLRTIAYLIYLIVLFRFWTIDMSYFYGSPLTHSMTYPDYLKILSERLVVFGTPIASLFVGERLIRTQKIESSFDTKALDNFWQSSQNMKKLQIILLSLAGLMLFMIANLETYRFAGTFFQTTRIPSLTAVWLVASLVLFFTMLRNPSEILRGIFFTALVVIGIKLVIIDTLSGWGLSHNITYAREYQSGEWILRFFNYGLMIAVLYYSSRSIAPTQQLPDLPAMFAAFGVLMSFIFLNLELSTFLYLFIPYLRDAGITVLWSIYAIGLVYYGLRKNEPAFRYVGLALFAATVIKLFLNDLDQSTQFVRIIAFLAIGVLILTGSFVYLMFYKRLRVQHSQKIQREDLPQ